MRKKSKQQPKRKRIAVNTPEETAQKLIDTPHRYHIYTDGGCDGNGQKGVWGKSGWGMHVIEVWQAATVKWVAEAAVADGDPHRMCNICCAQMRFCVCDLDAAAADIPGDAASTLVTESNGTRPIADLWGTVDTDESSRWYHGCQKGTNNTGELCSLDQALLWLLYEAESQTDPAVLCLDSCYSMEMAEGMLDPTKNLEAILVTQDLLARVRRTRQVTFIHVKGHSADGGNDRADELVQWGKEDGPYSRIDRHGRGQGAGRLRAEPAFEVRKEARIAAKEAAKATKDEVSCHQDSEETDKLEDEAYRAAMESVERDGLTGEEAELATWERAAELMASGEAQDQGQDEGESRRHTAVGQGQAVESAIGEPEDDLRLHNRIDARGFAVMEETSFLGWSGGALGPSSRLNPGAILSQKVADLNKT